MHEYIYNILHVFVHDILNLTLNDSSSPMRCDAMCPPLEPPKLTTASLYHTALSTLSLPLPPPPSHPLIPPPSTLPHSKLIPKTRFIIDAFKNPHPTFSLSYFLSHFHSDHYNGLSPNWSHGIIYCSPVTANLLHRVLQIPKPFIYALHLSQTVVIDGVEVSLVDANHCPGAVQFLFKFPEELCNGKTVRVEKYVHTGDFRYCDGMKSEGSLLCDFVGADAVFLDTTYCNPRFVFPSQEESVDYIVGVIDRIGVENAAEEKTKKNVLFLVATYVIGKEKILLEIARRCKRKICVSPRKTMVLQALDLGESCGVFTEDETGSDVHVIGWNVLGETWPYFRPNFVKMKEIMIEKGYSRVVGFVPTGWTYEVKRTKFAVRTKDECEIHLVPYSEHSSYSELREFVRFLKPKRVVPTVGADVEKMDSKVANAMRKHFAGLVDENAVKQEFLSGFLRIGAGPVDEEKDCASGSDDVSNKEEEIISNSPSHRDDVNVGSHVRTSSFHRELGSCELENAKENDVKKALLELSDCLPSWVTESLMLELLSNSDGCIVDAVSNFYERETEFYGHVFADVSMSCNIQTNSENEPALPFESSLFKSKDDDSVHVAFSQKFTTTSSSGSGKKISGVSPLKRKRNLNKKTTSRARTDDSKQYSITKFFNKKVCVVAEDGKTEDAVSHNNENKISLAVDATPLYLDEVNQFIQIVNGSESLRSSAFTILEKAKGDINLALNMYYNDDTFVSNEMKESLRDCNEYVDSESVSTMCPMDVDAQLLQTCQPEIKSDICCPVSKKNESSGSFISLPPERYYPIDHGCWNKGEPAPYLHIARTFNLVEEEKGKLKTTSMLCNMFRSLLALSPEDILPAVYLCTNHIAPEHENMELNVGGSIVVSSLEEACGTSRSKISALYKTLGDLGDVAQLCRQTQLLLAPPASLTIQGVYAALRKISVQTGSGSTTKKKNLIVSLMRSCREMEIKFLVRTLVRNLRIGAMMRTILPALAQAIVMNSAGDTTVENLKDQTQRLSSSVIEAYNMLPNLDLLIPSLMERGSEFSSSTLSMVPGTPIKPMLAKITNGAPQVLKSFQGRAFTCEYKYDGQRAQIHRLTDGSIHVFSRNGDETTSRFPDLVDIVKGRCGPLAVTFILDAEVVGIDRKNGMKLMSFQELSSRERGSRDSLIAVEKIKVGICVFVFDIMFANGEQLLGLSLRQRRKYLKELFGEEKPGFFEYAREMSLESHDADVQNEATLNRMNSFLENALCSSCEGIMVKSLDVDARYTPSKRSDAWLKVKRDYVEGLNDSLDLVPIGAWYGNGRKAGWFSPFLMACYNPDTEEFQSVCRVMSGFADSFYAEMKDFFSSDKILPKKPPYYRTAEEPNMWFSPELVWKIRGADFTVSPVHHAAIGLVHPSRGISVRFPRFIGSASDRKPEECSTSADIAEMFHLQSRKMNVNTCHE